jgi:hypothetical protein
MLNPARVEKMADLDDAQAVTAIEGWATKAARTENDSV